MAEPVNNPPSASDTDVPMASWLADAVLINGVGAVVPLSQMTSKELIGVSDS